MSKSDKIVEIPKHKALKARLDATKTRLGILKDLSSVKAKHQTVRRNKEQEASQVKESSMSIYSTALDTLDRLEKKAFLPADQVNPPADPAMMAGGGAPPMDPNMVDPAMMAGGGAPPMDPNMMDPNMMDPNMMDPNMIASMMAGGMPPAPQGDAPPPVAAPDPAAGGAVSGEGVPKMEDIAILEDRIAGLEDIISDLVNTMDAFGSAVEAKGDEAESGQPSSDGELAEPMGSPSAPGPLGGGQEVNEVLGTVDGTIANSRQDGAMMRTMNKLRDLRVQ